ncbi:MAG: response regulator [Nitrososphaerales archaeon]|jgi:DNA-binding response OmpR family regulator
MIASDGRAAARDAADGIGRPRIVIVDDDRDITLGLKLGLERKGFEVDLYNDPLDALAAMEPDRWDLAILDVKMPNMTGFELYRRLKSVDDGIAICFLTAFDIYKAEFSRLFPDIDAKAFFVKPIGIAELAARLDQFLLERASASGVQAGRL